MVGIFNFVWYKVDFRSKLNLIICCYHNQKLWDILFWILFPSEIHLISLRQLYYWKIKALNRIPSLPPFPPAPYNPHPFIFTTLRLVASANSPTVVELIVELIGELFIVELLYCNYLEFLKACFKIIHYKNTFHNVFNWNMPFENTKIFNSIILLWIILQLILLW